MPVLISIKPSEIETPPVLAFPSNTVTPVPFGAKITLPLLFVLEIVLPSSFKLST